MEKYGFLFYERGKYIDIYFFRKEENLLIEINSKMKLVLN